MIIDSLKLANIRAIENAEFRFRPGFNLIAGVNGVGKTTVLDILRICVSRILSCWPKPRVKSISFKADDIRGDFAFLDADVSLSMNEEEFRFLARKWREEIAADDVNNLRNLRRSILESELSREQIRKLLRDLDESQGVHDSYLLLPSKAEFAAASYVARVAPNCVFFSATRSVFSHRRPTKAMTAGGISAAYAEALVYRPMYLSQYAFWMRAQAILAVEDFTAKRHLEVLRSTAERFLSGYKNLRPSDEESPRLLIDQGGITLEVRQLSDGERGVLALVLELARRLSQANPSIDDPLNEAHAVVLIDEIELHLHPQWQRQIVRNLTETFPHCQFIATTHSPQVIGEVPHEHIHIMADGDVYPPPYSYGVDSSRVLEEIMNTDPRAAVVKKLLSQVSEVIRRRQFDRARDLVKQLVEHLGDGDPEVTRLRTLLDFMEGE